MSWTASILPLDKQNGNIRIPVLFTSGTNETFIEGFYASDLETLKRMISDRLANVNASFNLSTTIIPGPIDLTPNISTPTQAEIDKNTFFLAYSKLQNLKRLVDCGGLASSNKNFTDQIALVQSLFKPEYF